MSQLQYDDSGYLSGEGTFHIHGYDVSYKTNYHGSWYITITNPDRGGCVIAKGDAFIDRDGYLMSAVDCSYGFDNPQSEGLQFLYGEGESKFPLIILKRMLVKKLN